MRFGLSLWMAFWVLAGGATASLAGGVHRLDPNLPTIVYSDAFPDDFIALILKALHFWPSRGRNLLIVMVDGPTESKARGVHNLLHFFGITEATVLAGDPNKVELDSRFHVDYVRDYDVPQFANVLDALTSNTEPRPWIADNYRDVSKRFLARYPEVQLVFLANENSFASIQEEVDPSHIRQVYGLGPGKVGPGGALITAFNENTNVVAANAFFEWIQKHKVPYFGVSSTLISDLSRVEEATVEAKRKLMSSTEHNSALGSLDRALAGFIAAVRQNLFQNRGGLMEYVLISDPKHGGWNQDPTVFQVALDPERYCQFASMKMELDLTAPHPSRLGFPVTLTPAPGSSFFMATDLNVGAVASDMAEALARVQMTPNFDPKKLMKDRVRRPTAFVGFGAIDHEGALMGHLALGDLKLVIAESSRSNEIAERYRRTLAAYGRAGIPVVAGRGHSWRQMDAEKALGLETTVARAGGLSIGFLTDAERAKLNETDPSTLSGAEALEKFLQANKGVVIHDVSGGGTLLEVLRRQPSLVKSIAELHLMGGFRDSKKVGSRGYEGGIVTRCWLRDDEEKELFAILEKHAVRTWVASSHHSGGAANDVNMPMYTASLRKAEALLPVAQLQRGLRESWNAPLAAKLDPKTGLGPPLGYLGLARIAFGANADPYFSGTRGRFVFHGGGKVDFLPDDSSSITMLDAFHGYGSLDQTMALFTEQLIRKAPRAGLGRVVQVVENCAAWLRRRVTSRGQDE